MAQAINPATRAIKNYPADDRALFWTGTEYRPYTSVAEANATITATRRYKGLLVRLDAGWHEYKNGTADGDLIPWLPGSGVKKLVIKVDGEPDSPVNGNYTFSHPFLVNAVVEDILVNKTPETLVDGDFTHNIGTGTLTRVNPWVAGDTCIINYSS